MDIDKELVIVYQVMFEGFVLHDMDFLVDDLSWSPHEANIVSLAMTRALLLIEK